MPAQCLPDPFDQLAYERSTEVVHSRNLSRFLISRENGDPVQAAIASRALQTNSEILLLKTRSLIEPSQSSPVFVSVGTEPDLLGWQQAPGLPFGC